MAQPYRTASPVRFRAVVTVDLATINANTAPERTLTVPGCPAGRHYIVTAPSLEANVGIVGAKCTTKGSLLVRFLNPTGSGIDPASQDFHIIAI